MPGLDVAAVSPVMVYDPKTITLRGPVRSRIEPESSVEPPQPHRSKSSVQR